MKAILNPSKVIKYKFGFLAQKVAALSLANEYGDTVIFTGENLLPYIKDYQAANYMYDTIVLLELLWTSEKPKKILDSLYSELIKARKQIKAEDFMKFLRFWVTNKQNSYGSSAALIISIFIYIYFLLYQYSYSGMNQLDESKEDRLIEQDLLSGVMFCNILISLIGEIGWCADVTSASREYREWFMSLYSDENSIFFLRFLAQEKSIQNVAQVLVPNEIDYSELNDMLSHQFSNYKYNADTLRLALNQWDSTAVKMYVISYKLQIKNLLEYLQSIAYMNQAVLAFAPTPINTRYCSCIPIYNLYKNSLTFKPFQSFFSFDIFKDILQHRSVYIREDGIRIDTGGCLGIETLYVMEVHDENLHYVWATAKIKNGNNIVYRNYALSMEDIRTLGISLFVYTDDFYVLLLLFECLDLWNYFIECINELIGQSDDSKIINYISEMLSNLLNLQSEIKKFNFEFSIPRKDVSGYDSKAKYQISTNNILKKKDIGNYIRKLPLGYTASDEAREKAKQHCMFLPEGHTFVSSFQRKQWVKL